MEKMASISLMESRDPTHHLMEKSRGGVKSFPMYNSVCLGFVMCLVVCPWIEVYGVTEWPTREMISRGQLRSLWVGVIVAVPSGAGVALR